MIWKQKWYFGQFIELIMHQHYLLYMSFGYFYLEMFRLLHVSKLFLPFLYLGIFLNKKKNLTASSLHFHPMCAESIVQNFIGYFDSDMWLPNDHESADPYIQIDYTWQTHKFQWEITSKKLALAKSFECSQLDICQKYYRICVSVRK